MTGRLYYAIGDELYYITATGSPQLVSGFSFEGHVVSNATFVDGEYYFIGDEESMLYKVDPNAAMPQLEAVCDGLPALRYGDLVYDEAEGVFHASSLETAPSDPRYFSFDMNCTVIGSFTGPVNDVAVHRQMANTGSWTVAHHRPSKQLNIINPANGNVMSTISSVEVGGHQFSDMASAPMCER